MSMTEDFFRNRLDQLIDLRHPLGVLSNRMPRQQIEASLVHRIARQVRSGKKIEGMDMFGPTQALAGSGVSDASFTDPIDGLPAVPQACVQRERRGRRPALGRDTHLAVLFWQ
jgi:hypothetical protein